jgi:Cytochrome c554 and c-prime
MNPHKTLGCFVLVLGALLVLIPGCGPSSKPTVSIYVAGDTKGWITPCGCAANQSGGLARRAVLLEQSKRVSEVLLLDVGGSAIGVSPYQQTRLTFLLKGLKQMNLSAHNIGAAETAFSPSELRAIGSETQTAWLGSNLLDSDGKPVGKTLVKSNQAGLRIDIAGVIDPSLIVHPEWRSLEPLQAILNTFKNSDADVRVVLAYLDERGLRELAGSLPDVDYIIGGPTGQSINPTRNGLTTMLSTTNKGKFLGKLELAKDKNSFREISSSIVEVKSDLPEHPVQVANLQEYYTELSKKDYVSLESGLVHSNDSSNPNYSIAGSETCAKCHVPDDSIWHQSKHSHAWDVLRLKKAHFDPTCQQCHTTGYAQPGGFVNVAQSSERIHVGCENCHGPSQSHVLDPKKRTPFQAKEQCLGCHDHENSPTFQQETYWAKILHGGSKIKP